MRWLAVAVCLVSTVALARLVGIPGSGIGPMMHTPMPSCTPLTCVTGGYDCGTPSDGCGGTLSCGNCALPETCGGGGSPNVCGCTPTTCVAEGYDCGTPDDGCGTPLSSCGTCTSPDVCSDTTYTCVLSDLDFEAVGTGIAHKGDIPSGFAEPHFFWDSRTPLVWTGQWCASEPCSLSWNGTASTTTMTLPKCTDGSYDDLSSANCMKAMYFDGGATIGYLTTDTSPTWSGTSSSFIVYAWEDYDTSAATAAVAVATDEVASGVPGFQIDVQQGDARLTVASDGAAVTTAASDSAPGQMMYVGGIITVGGNQTAFTSTTAGVNAAPAAPYTPAASPISIGARPDGTSPMRGWISQILIFDGNDYATTISRVGRKWRYGDIMFGNDRPTAVNTGGDLIIPTSDGKWHHFADQWMTIGNTVPNGRTGGGNACMGMSLLGNWNGTDWTNNLLYNLDMTAGGWVETGSSVITYSATGSPFADGRKVSRIQDNDGAASEYVTQSIASTLSTNQKGATHIWAKSTSGTQAIDLRITETTGGTCPGFVHTYTPQAVGTTWTELQFNFTKNSGLCLGYDIDIAAVSGTGVDAWTDTSDTASDIILMAAFYETKVHLYPYGMILTEGTAVSHNNDDFYWNNVAGLDLKPNGTDPYRFRIKMFPFDSAFNPDATHNNVVYAYVGTSSSADGITLTRNNTDAKMEFDFDGTTATEGTMAAWTQGTLATYDMLFDIDGNTFTLEENSVEIGADGAFTTTAPAVAWDSLWIGYGTYTDATTGIPPGYCINYVGWENIAP